MAVFCPIKTKEVLTMNKYAIAMVLILNLGASINMAYAEGGPATATEICQSMGGVKDRMLGANYSSNGTYAYKLTEFAGASKESKAITVNNEDNTYAIFEGTVGYNEYMVFKIRDLNILESIRDAVAKNSKSIDFCYKESNHKVLSVSFMNGYVN